MLHMTTSWITGTVIEGDHRGRTLGFPTANIRLTIPSQRPAEGIWVVRVRLALKTRVRPGVMHVGPRPTFDQPQSVVEIHLIEYPDQSLYGQELMFQCVQYLRGVEKFSDMASLIAAMQQDVQRAQRVLQKDHVS